MAPATASTSTLGKTNGNPGNGISESGDRHHRPENRVDPNRWRMRAIDGRQTWHYLQDDEEVKQWPQTYADKWYLGLPIVRSQTCFTRQVNPKSHLNTRVSNPLTRTSLTFQNPKNRLTQFIMALNSSLISNYLLETGVPSSAAQCSSSPASSSPGT